MTNNIVCCECKCSLVNCNDYELSNKDTKCKNCIKEICCCIPIHKNKLKKSSLSLSSTLSLKSKSKLLWLLLTNIDKLSFILWFYWLILFVGTVDDAFKFLEDFSFSSILGNKKFFVRFLLFLCVFFMLYV